MTEPYIIYNGIDSRDFGVVIEKLPDLHRAPENVKYTPVDGRDGQLEEADGTSNIYTDGMRVNCFGRPLRDVYAWLSGAGWMISSDEPERKVWVSIHLSPKNSRFRVEDACYDSVTFTLMCQPYRYFYPDVPDTIITERPGVVDNPGTQRSAPVITIRASGDFMVIIGKYQMDFEGVSEGIIVDCDLQECFSLDRMALMNQNASMDDFPMLEPGENDVEWIGSVESITVERRCRDR